MQFPCLSCQRPTSLIHLKSQSFFCDLLCFRFYRLSSSEKQECDQTEVIHSTREIRRRLKKRCALASDQKCHAFGLNAAKEILNVYAQRHCARIDEETLAELVSCINDAANIYCCSAEQNKQDTETERLFLDVFLYHKACYATLNDAACEMYEAMKRVFTQIQEKKESPLLVRILADFAKIEEK